VISVKELRLYMASRPKNKAVCLSELARRAAYTFGPSGRRNSKIKVAWNMKAYWSCLECLVRACQIHHRSTPSCCNSGDQEAVLLGQRFAVPPKTRKLGLRYIENVIMIPAKQLESCDSPEMNNFGRTV
jgi:hypothetical protein